MIIILRVFRLWGKKLLFLSSFLPLEIPRFSGFQWKQAPGGSLQMTGQDKTNIAAFLDLSADVLANGYRKNRESYRFDDDSETVAVPDSDSAALPDSETIDMEDSLEAVAADIALCTRCGLCKTRTNTVPGEGPARPLVMVVGEGPGADEDVSGRPFVGKAGQLLDRMLDSRGKIGLYRAKNCYIANVVKCRPPGNRNPQPEEISACMPFLARQITILKPKIILAAGNTAVKALLHSTEGITRLRGNFTFYTGTLADSGINIPLLPTFHPSALLRDESLKLPVWEDMKTLRAKLCELDGDYGRAMADIPL
jgi:DNA polymerase